MKQVISLFGIQVLLHALGTGLFAQVKGKVVDAATGEPLPGASVVYSREEAVVTDTKGYFKLEHAGPIDSLDIRHLGYTRKVVAHPLDFQIYKLEPDPLMISEAVVTASRIPVSLKKSPGSLSLVNLLQTDRLNEASVNNVLNSIPGVYVAGGTLTTNRLIIRGIGSRTPYNSNRIRVYFDEFPLTTGDGVSTHEELSPELISKTEVLKGPGSALYGSGLGGVVKLIPGIPFGEGLSGNSGGEFASFLTRDYQARVNFSSSQSFISLTGSLFDSEGYRENNQTRREQIFLYGGRENQNLELRILLLYTGLYAQIPSSLNIEDFESDPSSAADNWARIGGYEDNDKFFGGLRLSYQWNEKSSTNWVIFGSATGTYESRPFNILETSGNAVGTRFFYELENPGFTLRAGGELFSEKNNWKIFETQTGQQGSRLNENQESRQYANVFFHSRLGFISGLIMEPALNINILSYRVDDLFLQNEDRSGDYSYEPVVSPRLGFNYTINSKTTVYWGAGHGFSAPSLEETLLPEGEVNTSLKPESGWNFDLGLRKSFLEGRLFSDVSLYHIRLSNLLVNKRIAEDIFSGINAGRANYTGLEGFLYYSVFPVELQSRYSLLLRGGVTLSNNKFIEFTDDGIDFSGNHLPGIPKVLVNLDASFSVLENFNAHLGYQFFGEQYLDDGNTGTYPGKGVLSLKLTRGFRIPSSDFKIRFYGGVQNIMNNQYASMILINAPSFGGARPRYYYPANPRSYFLGLRLEFNDSN